jgi:signal transduction histidine kinase
MRRPPWRASWTRSFFWNARSRGFAEHAPRLRLDLAADLPPAWIDPGVLRLAVGNLVGNALKYSPQGTPVSIRLRREKGDAVLTVADRGIGIPAADHARLFEPFHRGRNVGEISGSGLGLVIVRKGVDLHGGSIDLESAEGAGTTFTLRLPVFRRPEADSPEASQPRPTPQFA